MIHALQYQDTIICINKIQGMTRVIKMTRAFFAVCFYLSECTWVKNPATHKGSENTLKIQHWKHSTKLNPPPKSNHYTTLETTTNSQVQQKKDLWAWMKRAAMRFPNPVAKKQREVSEDRRMSCSNQRDSGFCSNLISPLKSFLDLKRHPECMGLPQSKALTTQASELFRMEDEIRTAWKTLVISS